jgi:hypothetical protein
MKMQNRRINHLVLAVAFATGAVIVVAHATPALAQPDMAIAAAGVVNATDFAILEAAFNKGAALSQNQSESADSEGIRYTLLGDADLNGIANGQDFAIIAANFNKGVSS